MNRNNVQQHYSGDGDTHSDALVFAVSGTLTGEYVIPDTLVGLAVDANWTTATVGIDIYNPVTQTYQPLYAADGTTLVTWAVEKVKPIYIDPTVTVGLKKVKFRKSTAQLTNASKLIITTAIV